ncbi:hypothetical protein BJV85_003293 [Clostridium acetobutylicum]|uniref:membrane protein n=1 Tax=Clostridium TaxID=1485 RepID=UPI000200A71D|nr:MULTISPECIES: membrane protein [Clostridium]ADZ19767.1 membrane protein [Clostridium acetobutylicum EA 2018]AEI31389.1 membrane protein [Clostridium acetobutylicum DSM 1731]AWV80413.1 hypothetical protein DK921_09965 [Clostridium acetobutylicum]MBC2392602.1 hypothetical protein [Clostridium acetobutylicum]MBC2584430.1 hypothetical protein [Clostridium acetobutylicum]
MKKVRTKLSLIVSAAFTLSFIGILPPQLMAKTSDIPVVETKYKTASDNAYTWLKTQQDSAKLDGTGLPSGMVDSFEDYWGPNLPKQISYTYDQGVAAIAFLLKGDTNRTKNVLTLMSKIQGSDGSWCNSYWNNNLSGQELIKNVGPGMWICLAVMNYEKITGDTSFHSMATKYIDWALQFQKPNGGISGGQTYASGVWQPVTWSGTEENIDAYAALKYFSSTTPDKSSVYESAQNRVKSFLDNIEWDNTNNRFHGGFKNDTQTVDPYVPLDVNPWGVMALSGASNPHNYASSLAYIENAKGNASGVGTLSNPKYVETLTAADNGKTMTLYDFDWESDNVPYSSDASMGLKGPDIWFEGSAFMSCAYYMQGNTSKADSIIDDIMKKQSTSSGESLGGIPYSLMGTNNNYWHMAQENCVSSTGWFIIASSRWNPFTGEYLNSAIPTPTPTPVDTSYGVTKTGDNSAVIWFSPSPSAAWADVHYVVNSQNQLNYRMTYNSIQNRWEQNVTGLKAGDTIKYSFTYWQTAATDSPSYNYTF